MDKEERMAYLMARRQDVDRLLMAFQQRVLAGAQILAGNLLLPHQAEKFSHGS